MFGKPRGQESPGAEHEGHADANDNAHIKQESLSPVTHFHLATGYTPRSRNFIEKWIS